jgi:very-short-patch-repair endonuclease
VILESNKSIDDFRKLAARKKRTNATGAEARLWWHLKRHPMLGSHFRRQVALGPYIAAFACMAVKLVIKVDGSQHGEGRNLTRDQQRTDWFAKQGYRVLRFWNNEVFQNSEGVLEAIHIALGPPTEDVPQMKHQRRRKVDHPTPASFARRPSPSRGG